jgi:TonB family protein
MLKNTLFLFLSLVLSSLSYAQVTESKIDTAIITTPEIDAEYIGGFDGLVNYLATNLSFIGNPKNKRSVAKEERLEGGRLIVRFIIEKDGSITHVKLESKLPKCEPCNQDAIRVVKNMPKWKPASDDGKAVRTYVRLPIVFDVD